MNKYMEQLKPKFDFKYYGVYAVLLCIPYIMFFMPWYLYNLNIIILIPPLIFAVVQFLKYSSTNFLIGTDKVSYINNFFNYTRVDIKYEDIKELSVTQGFLQRMFGLGAVSMISSATINQAGITFYSIENPREVYDIIQQKIAESKK